MCFRGTFGEISIFALLFCLMLISITFGGEIKSPLDEMIGEADAGEKIKVLAVLAEQIDNEQLNQNLKARNATLQRRHYEVITKLQQKAQQTQGPVMNTLLSLESKGEVENIRAFWITNVIAFAGTPRAIEAIAALKAIEKVEFDLPVELIEPFKTGDGDEPLIAGHEQGLDVINAPAVWAMGYTGAGRLVSNIDTGVEGGHPALSSRWRGNNGHPASECWYDPVGNTSFPMDYGQHGTHTMGTICGRSSTTYDTVGVAIDAQWIACASIDNGSSTSDVIASFQFIADPDNNPNTTDDVPDVVSNSWGWSPFFHGVPHCDNTFWSAMDACENAGVAVVFAAGNEGSYGSNSLRTPADRASTYYNAFAVGAIDGHTQGYPIASFSSLGPCQCASGDMNIKPELVAPGVNVRSSVPGGGYQSGWSGTSMACPHIAGAVAILRQVNPSLDVDMIKQILIQSCIDLGPSGEDNTYGNGYLNLLTAVQLASTDMGYVEGYVRDADYNTPLEASVSVVGSFITTTANSQGYYLLSLPADTSYTIRASYPGYNNDQAHLYITIDDTLYHDFSLIPPIISYSPISYNVSVEPGEILNRNLYIINTGVGEVIYNITSEVFDLPLSNGQPVPVTIAPATPEPLGYRMPESDKPDQTEEPYFPPVTTGQGGPDNYGYTWIDSDEPGGPSVSWVNISGPGIPVSLSDDSYQAVSIGFSFPFYGNNYSTTYITSNGLLTFGSGSTDYTNDPIPSSYTPQNFIAPFWDDLSPQNGGTVLYYNDSANDRFIVSWLNTPFYTWYGGTGSVNFQVILYQNGQIEFNYQSMNPGSSTLASATIGIENYNASDGLQVAFNQSYMHSNMSIRISSGYWLSIDPTSGSVPANDTNVVVVTFDATQLPEDTYTGNINLINNTPNNPDIDIPVTLNVTSIPTPLIELNVSLIADTVYSGYTTIFDLQITNAGDALLTYNLSDNRAWISESPSSGDVSPGGTDNIDITFDASSLAPGTYTGTVTVNSNDPNNPTINLPVNLIVELLITDDVGVTEIISPPDSMVTGTTYPVSVKVANFGSDPQSFDVIFEAYYEGNPTPMFVDTLSISSMPDSSNANFQFGEDFTPDIQDDYIFTAYTLLTSDQVPGNDTINMEAAAYNIISIWYGNLDLSPVTAAIDESVFVDVYVQTPPSAYIGDMHLCLGADNDYIDSLISESTAIIHYPLSDWTVAEFTSQYGSPPNPAGWISQSFIGFARLSILLDDNPWLHSESPLKVMSFLMTVANNNNLIGDIEPAIGPGLSPIQGPSNAGDTIGGLGYGLAEQFSELEFTPPASRIVNIWYGRTDDTPINAWIGHESSVDVYVQTSEEGYIADMHLCLGADEQYIDSMISQTQNIIYYPLTEWVVAEFLEQNGAPPNPDGWISQSFIGFARLSLILDENPWLHSTTPTRIMKFILDISDNLSLDGQTYPAIGAGLNNIQGPSNAGDTIGGIGFYLIEHFSELYFTETPFGCDYMPGDINSDGQIIGSDVTYLVQYFAMTVPPPPDSCWNDSTETFLYAAADANGDCQVIGSDVTYMVNYFRMLNDGPQWCPQTPPMSPPVLGREQTNWGEIPEK